MPALDVDRVLQEMLTIAAAVTGAGQAEISRLDGSLVRGSAAGGVAGGVVEIPIVVRDRPWGTLRLAGGEFSEADERAGRALAGWAATVAEDLERAAQRLEATTAIAHAVGTETDLQDVLELIVARGRALVEARSLVLLLADAGDLVVASSAGQVDTRATGARLPRATTAMGEVLKHGRAERVDDVATRLALDDARLGVVGAETGLLVPLLYRGEPVGVLAAFDRLADDPQFGDDDESLLAAFAASAATAVATAQSVERERLRHSIEAAERERRRWARELHDETLQGLAALKMLLTTGLRHPDQLEEAVRTAVDQVGEEVVNLRRMITELRPAALDELGLGPTIDTLVHGACRREGLETALRVDLGRDRLPAELETDAYRFVQEALTNVVKHARATRVSVAITRAGEALELEVRDDGCGFDPDGTAAAGFGLVGMRERVAVAGGAMSVESGPGGTSVRARFPIRVSPSGCRP